MPVPEDALNARGGDAQMLQAIKDSAHNFMMIDYADGTSSTGLHAYRLSFSKHLVSWGLVATAAGGRVAGWGGQKRQQPGWWADTECPRAGAHGLGRTGWGARMHSGWAPGTGAGHGRG